METGKPQRLCSEIQLFDLCDLESCRHKNGRYCTNPEALAKFEAIAEEDERAPERYLAEDYDENGDEESEDQEYEGSLDRDDYGDDDL